jgi:signal transduction histidine kinase
LGRARRGQRQTPAWRLTAALTAALGAVFLLYLLASHQPRFGLSFTESDDKVLVSGPAMESLGIKKPVQAVSIAAPEKGRVALTPQTLTEEPNFLPDFATIAGFMAEQGRIADILSGEPVLTVVLHGRTEDIVLQRQSRGRLPFSFWYQIAIGLTVYAVAVWLWSLTPRYSNRLFALSSLGMLITVGAAAVYSSRELAIPTLTFRLLGMANELGGALYGTAMAHLFLVYPRVLISRIGAVFLWVLFSIWAWAGMLRLVPDPSLGNNGLMVAEMMVIIGAVIWQFFATRGDPLARSALRWLGIGTVLGACAFVLISAIPMILDKPPPVSQSTAFGFFLLIVAIVAIGLRRDRLFALDRLSYEILYYSATAALFIAADVALVLTLGSERLAGIVTAVALLPLLYLPVRDRAIAWISGFQQPEIGRILETVTRMSFVRTSEERTCLWKESLDHAFQPLTIDELDELDEARERSVRLVDDGAAMIVPPIAGMPPLLLRYAHKGRALFRQKDCALAERLAAMAARADAERAAYERGVDAERARVARDLHDDLAARLMDGLAGNNVESLRETIRLGLVEVRSIVNGSSGAQSLLSDTLADVRAEAAERLEVAGIGLDWEPIIFTGALTPAKTRALQSAVREAITNITRHSGASHVEVQSSMTAGLLHLSIADNGRGDGSGPIIAGNGQRNVAYRMASAGGSAAFSASPGGFSVALTLSVDEQA